MTQATDSPFALAVPTPAVIESEVAFISGVDALSRVEATSFWTWRNNTPATYSTTTSQASKWGASGTPGTAGGVVTYSFSTAAGWTPVEKDALVSGLKLWSVLANISFTEAAVGATANLNFQRGTDGSAYETDTHTSAAVNAAAVGRKSVGRISIDTSVAGFGPIGDDFVNYGGYPWQTLVHEIGHFLGLGHGGAYNGNVDPSRQQFSAADNRLYSLMSYIDPFTTTATYFEDGTFWGTSLSSNGSYYANRPTTPMIVDILAIQRLYGTPVASPLSGGNVFGFNTNITGEIAKFFDFTVNTRPVVTLWSSGLNNTLDLSGFSTPSVINLKAGGFSSAGYDVRLGRAVTNNIAIALGVRIDTGVGGGGDDVITANDNGNRLVGNSGADTLNGGTGADTLEGGAGTDCLSGGQGSDILYGNQDGDLLYGEQDSDTLYGGQGGDTLYGGEGADSLYGNLGDDLLDGGYGADRLDGGDGIDTATYAAFTTGVAVSLILLGAQPVAAGASHILAGVENLTGSAFADTLTGDTNANVLTGGLGADVMSGGFGADVLYGNQDGDVLYGNQDADTLYGGQGADTLYGGQGDDVVVGGLAADTLAGNLGADVFTYLTAGDSTTAAADTITDFVSALDRIDLRAVRTGAGDTFAIRSGGGLTFLEVDLGGDATVDLRIAVVGEAAVQRADVVWG